MITETMEDTQWIIKLFGVRVLEIKKRKVLKRPTKEKEITTTNGDGSPLGLLATEDRFTVPAIL